MILFKSQHSSRGSKDASEGGSITGIGMIRCFVFIVIVRVLVPESSRFEHVSSVMLLVEVEDKRQRQKMRDGVERVFEVVCAFEESR